MNAYPLPAHCSRPTLRPLLLFPLVVAAAPALAQDARPDSTSRDSLALQLQTVQVTAVRAIGVAGGAGAIVVRPGQLRSSPAPLLDEALREAPFVHVRQNSRGEMELSVRGSDSRQAAVLLDGVPVSLGWDHRVDPSLVPATGTQTLTIVRGLGSLLLGPNTLGGTIEVRHDNGAGGLAARGVRAGFGIDNTGATVASLGASGRLPGVAGGGVSLEVGGAHRQRDGVPLPSEAIDPSATDGLRTNSDLEHIDGFASLRWRTPDGWRAGLTVSGFDAERGVPPEEHLRAPRLWRYPDNRRAIAALSLGTGGFRTPLGYASAEIGAGFNFGTLKIETFSDRSYSTVTGQELGRERTWTSRASLTQSVGSGVLRVAFTRADVRYRETLDADPPADYRQVLWSAASEIELPLGSRTSLAGGVVLDRASTPETGGRAPQEPLTNPGWRAGLSHELSETVRLHASASRRSRFPALRELYSGALNRFLPNPDLEPETLFGIESGVTASGPLGTAQASLQLTGFRHRLSDAVVRITLPDQRFQRVNRDRIDSYGVEALVGLAFGSRRAVTLSADALLQKISVRSATPSAGTARHAENNPEARGSFEVGVPLPFQARLFGNARYTGPQYCLNSETGAELRLAGRVEPDLALERSFILPGEGWFGSLRALIAIDNVTNQTVFDQCGLPQPGRTARVMITLR